MSRTLDEEMITSLESFPPDSPEGLRLRQARYMFEFLVSRGVWLSGRDWGRAPAKVKAAFIDGLAMLDPATPDPKENDR